MLDPSELTTMMNWPNSIAHDPSEPLEPPKGAEHATFAPWQSTNRQVDS